MASTKLARTSQRPAAYHQRLRERIKTGQIVGRVQRCALGEEEMTNVEFQAAKLLINKTIPDLPVEAVDPLAGAKDVSGMSPHALLQIIEGEAHRLDTVTIEAEEVER